MSIGILLLHGFAGSRGELAPLQEYLERDGFIVSVPVLSGHELTRKDFAKSKYTDWIKSAADAANVLQKRCSQLIVIGFSMGGLIAVNLQRDMDVEKLVLINTPVYYWDIKRILKNLTDDFAIYAKKYFTASTGKPLSSLLEFLKLLRKTKPLFSGISCPALIIQTLDDDTVNCKSADFIFQNIKGEKVLKKHEKGGHLLFGSDAATNVCLDIGNALRNDKSKSYRPVKE